MKTWICHPAYVLGERQHHYTELPRWEERLTEYGMPNLPAMWGWGHYRATDLSRFVFAEPALGQCLEKFPVIKLDHVIVSTSTVSGGFMASNDGLRELLGRHGLHDIAVSGVSLTGCNNALSAILLGRALLMAKLATNVLVLTVEQAQAEERRFDRHCIFSDAASAFVLSSEYRSELEIVDIACRFSPAATSAGNTVFRGNLKKVKEGYEEMLAQNGLAESDLATVVAPNYYLPLQQMLFSSAGLPNARRFAGSTKEQGHCFSCDYVINLQAYLAGTAARDEHLMLFAYADMHYGLCLLRRAAGAASTVPQS